MSHNITGSTLFRNLRTRVDITVETIADRDALLTYKRRWGMVVAVYDDPATGNNGFYYLKKGKNSDILGDNNNWEAWGSGNKYYQDTTPDPNQASEGDVWMRPLDMRLFEIITAGANQFWAEVTSPKIT